MHEIFSLGILSRNCDFMGSFNLTITSIQVKFCVFEFLGLLCIQSYKLKIVSKIELIPSPVIKFCDAALDA